MFEGVKVFTVLLVESDDDDGGEAGRGEQPAGVRGEAELMHRLQLSGQLGHLHGGRDDKTRDGFLKRFYMLRFKYQDDCN